MIILDTVKLVKIYVKVDDFMLELSPSLEQHLLGSFKKYPSKFCGLFTEPKGASYGGKLYR